MDRADWLRITAALGVALVSSDSTMDQVRTMVLAARDEWVVATAPDRVSVNLDEMNVGGMLTLPYVEGTIHGAVTGIREKDALSGTAAESRPGNRAPSRSIKPIHKPAPTYSRALRGARRFTA
jgi:hypothetical protein